MAVIVTMIVTMIVTIIGFREPIEFQQLLDEALFATGMGLVAAIPAVIFYNKFTGDLTKLGDQLDTFSQDVLVRLSRRASDPARD